MFMGEYHHTIDEKGRLTIPSKIRYELGEDFIITRGLDGCLFIYKKETWNKIIQQYQNLPNIKETRTFMRFFLSGADNTTFDKQGRINITSPLISYAKLKKDCVIIGVGDHLEIWNNDTWNNFLTDNIDNLSEVCDDLFKDSNA